MIFKNIIKGSCRNNVSCSWMSTTVEHPKTGIVMLNMGGPQSEHSVKDYLTRIMTDTDIMQLPFQKYLGTAIASMRAQKVKEKYISIGGYSPILKWTNIQGDRMCKKLDKISPNTAPHKHYVAFRYTEPLAETALNEIEKDNVKRVVLFSQYPQYSCSTSGSSFNEIYSICKQRSLPSDISWSIIDRWSGHPFLIKTFADRIAEELKKFPDDLRSKVVILFSAHSLPLNVVCRGDTYPFEVGNTVNCVMQELGYCNPYLLTWQSKVGPLKWLEPFTDKTMEELAKRGHRHLLIVPIAFVNEHIETLHELDIEYIEELAKEKLGLEHVRRVAAPNDHPLFIDALADIVASHLRNNVDINPKFLIQCPGCVNQKCYDTKQWFRSLCKG